MKTTKKNAVKKTAKKKGNKLKVDFTDVAIGGGGVRIPEGSYLARPVEATQEESSGGNDMIVFVFQVVEGKKKGTKLYWHCPLLETTLWKLRNTIDAMGIETPDGPMDIDLDAIVEDEDIVVTIEVEDDDYQGKTRSKITAVFAAEGEEGEGKEEEEEEEDDKGEKSEEPDFDEMDSEALEAFSEEHGLDVDLSKLKTTSKKRSAVAEAYSAASDGDNDSSNDGDEKGGDGNAELTEEEINGFDEDELAEINDQFELGVKLDKFPTLKKKRIAVWEAYEESQGAEGDKDSGDEITEDAINEMGTSELVAFVKEHKLKVTLDGTTRKKRRTVVAAAKEKGLIEE